MSSSDKKKLSLLEVKYYEDDKCKDYDKKKFGSKYQERLDFKLNKCLPHPFYKGKYTMMAAMPSAGAVLVVLLLLCCCCCCACVACWCFCKPGGESEEKVVEHHVYEEHHVVVEHHEDRSRSRSRSGSHHSEE